MFKIIWQRREPNIKVDTPTVDKVPKTKSPEADQGDIELLRRKNSVLLSHAKALEEENSSLKKQIEMYSKGVEPTPKRVQELLETTNRYLNEKRYYRAMALYYVKYAHIVRELAIERPEVSSRIKSLKLQVGVFVLKPTAYGFYEQPTRPCASDYNMTGPKEFEDV